MRICHILKFPAKGRKIRCLVANDDNLIKIADDFFTLGDPFKARMCIHYLVMLRLGGYRSQDEFLRYLSSLVAPFGVIFRDSSYLSRYYKMPSGVRYVSKK